MTTEPVPAAPQELPPLDLADQATIELHRNALIADLPALLDGLGLTEQAEWLRTGEHERAAAWFKDTVSVKNQGIAEGGFNVTTSQAHVINPFAIKHGFMPPNITLWGSEDAPADTGLVAGDVRAYPTTPDYDAMPGEVFQFGRVRIVGGAKLRGLKNRFDNSIEQVERTDPGPDDDPTQPHEVVILTGIRRVGADEGETREYTAMFGNQTPPSIQEIFPTETDEAIGVIFTTLYNVQEDVEARIDDPQAGNKPPERVIPDLQNGSRTWIARYFMGTTASGKRVRVTVMNGEPVVQPEALNRSRKEGAPVLADTFSEWLATLPPDQAQDIALSVNYPHLYRIGARLIDQVRKTGTQRQVGSLLLAGVAASPDVWNEVKNSYHQGVTTIMKEIWPSIRVLNRLSGRDQEDLTLA